jgi:hypothetical protein
LEEIKTAQREGTRDRDGRNKEERRGMMKKNTGEKVKGGIDGWREREKRERWRLNREIWRGKEEDI